MNAHRGEPWLHQESKKTVDGGLPTGVYITIDTEYEFGFTARQGKDSRSENFRRSISCETQAGAVGIEYQLDVFDAHGLNAVFFVDPMPALVWGVEAIRDVVSPIVTRGHDVQLHIHTEWLKLAGSANPLPGLSGDNIKDFSFEQQCLLLDYARAMLIDAGAPAPVAFRAGNYGANDDTLRALAEVGMAYDTSHSPGFPGSACAISLGAQHGAPILHQGVIEVPIGHIGDHLRGTRHAQLTALSAAELLAAIRHERDSGGSGLTVVSHSFELLSRDRKRINRIVKRRFERFCAGLAALEGAETATYASRPPAIDPAGSRPAILPPHLVREGLRLAEQTASNALYGR